MDHPLVIVVLTVLALLALRTLVALILAGGDIQRIAAAFRVSLRILRDPEFAAQVQQLQPRPPNGGRPPSGAPLRLLALMQREGRIVDFLLEDIQAYPDAQIGAAVRDIHRNCQAVLKEHVALEPVLPDSEGSTVEVPAEFDPAAVRLVGNVTGRPPFRGTLHHRGWRVRELKLAPPPAGQDEFILMPAEVELP